jgi:hypothetical protein
MPVFVWEHGFFNTWFTQMRTIGMDVEIGQPG